MFFVLSWPSLALVADLRSCSIEPFAFSQGRRDVRLEAAPVDGNRVLQSDF